VLNVKDKLLLLSCQSFLIELMYGSFNNIIELPKELKQDVQIKL